MPSKPRPCSFVSTSGRQCAHPALPRRPYCHVHTTINEVAGTVAGGFVGEVMSWFGGGAFGGGSSPFDREPPANGNAAEADAEFDRLINEIADLMGRRARGQAAAPPAPFRRILNYYNVLGVAPSAPTAQIKAAFRKLAFDNHPDRQKDKPPAEQRAAVERFKKAAEAWGTLGDPKKRAEYDALLRYARPVATGG